MKQKKLKFVTMKRPQFKSGLRRPGLPQVLRRKKPESDAKLIEAIQNLPRITNETVAEHREEVLSSARKYIYPLSHSKRRIVMITGSLLLLAVVLFFTYCTLALYKFKSNSTFIYGVTQVIPFPVAKAGPSWVSYESYLFELRHSIHYYQTQQNENFGTRDGKKHLAKLEQDAMNQVVEDAYVKQLAAKNGVSVSTKEVDNQMNLLREQNRLGSNDTVFRNVLSEFWGWTIDDFRRELKQQLLAQKLVSKLDTSTHSRAQTTLAQLNQGTDFATLASQVSDDPATKANGGSYGVLITSSNHDLPVQVVQQLFKLKPGDHTGIIDTGPTLEIDKVLDGDATGIHAARIVFTFKPLRTYVTPQQSAHKPHYYIGVK